MLTVHNSTANGSAAAGLIQGGLERAARLKQMRLDYAKAMAEIGYVPDEDTQGGTTTYR